MKGYNMKKITFEIKKNKQYYFHIKASNGKILCHSENYRSRASARKTVFMIIQKITGGNFKFI